MSKIIHIQGFFPRHQGTFGALIKNNISTIMLCPFNDTQIVAPSVVPISSRDYIKSQISVSIKSRSGEDRWMMTSTSITFTRFLPPFWLSLPCVFSGIFRLRVSIYVNFDNLLNNTGSTYSKFIFIYGYTPLYKTLRILSTKNH